MNLNSLLATTSLFSSSFRTSSGGSSPGPASPSSITTLCHELAVIRIRGELGLAIADLVLRYSPRNLEQMRWNFSEKIKGYAPELKTLLEETITAHLHGTYQQIRLMNQQGVFATLQDSVTDDAPAYWEMVVSHCTTGDEARNQIRFLKFLLSGFCMFVQKVPGHPVGMPFPGGDKVDYIDGVYYCPVRTKANDVDAALCPFCPAEQTPEIGYLKPPINASEHRKQEFIKNCYDFHHFNG
ncbi:MAG: DUF2115 domain-containing protein [Methanospirillum sp.]|uniref:DUF2115 domain-containing protein n=1 Tax=Methanospirillum sp. TaxID=45200 RepID=UPI002375870A|nr:DUF2115 domain-containing protein [Methanospirillum sp.]MDD1729521.1 DUF2115 domain-containing protein [Methanospirillum sp.]